MRRVPGDIAEMGSLVQSVDVHAGGWGWVENCWMINSSPR